MKTCVLVAAALLISFLSYTQNNYAVSFDGSSSANCGSNSGLNITGTAITVEAWIYPTSFTANYWEGSIVAKDAQNNTGYTLRCGGSGQLSFVIALAGNLWSEAISGTNVLALNKWQHVAGVYNGSNILLYVDGKQVASTTENRTLLEDGSYPVMIGASPGIWTPARRFTGAIDEARIWNVSKTPAEIRDNMFRHLSAGTGLIASYQMSDGSGTSITDNSGNGNTATLSGGSWVASPIQLAGNALAFDGVDDYVNVPHQSSQDISAAITLEAWVYASSTTTVQNVICKSTQATNTGYIFPRTDDGWGHTTFWLHIGGSWKSLSAPYPSRNTWHHLAATYDGAEMKIYVDGTLSASMAATGPIAVNSNNLTLGLQPGYPEYFGGRADEIRVWNVARTMAQIQADMNKDINPATASGLVAYFNVNQGIASGTNTGLTTLLDQTGTQNGTLVNFTLSGAGSNYVVQNSNLVVLPLTWVSFTAGKNGSDVKLDWTTANEYHTNYFLVQHSTDGNNWTALARINAAAAQQYSFIHQSPAKGIHFYRLQQFDIDGASTYSKICTVRLGDDVQHFNVFPNPATRGYCFIQMDKAGPLQMFDAAGRCVRIIMLEKGLQQINTQDLPAGLYHLRSGETNLSESLIIK